MTLRPLLALAGLGAVIGLAALSWERSRGESPRTPASAAPAPGPRVTSGRWTLHSIPTRSEDGTAGLAFTGHRSAVVLGGGSLGELGVGSGLEARRAAPRDVLDGPVAAGPRGAALLVSRPAPGGRAELAVVLVGADGSPPTALPVRTVDGPRSIVAARLDASADGDLSVVWSESVERERILIATAPPGGPFGPPSAVGPVLYDAPEPDLALAVGAAGHAVVVTNGRRGLIARVRPPGGALGSPELVGPTHGQDDIDAGVGAGGSVLVAWSTTTPGEEAEEGAQRFDNRVSVYAARRGTRAGRFGRAQRLLTTDPESDEGLPDVAAALDAAGRATVIFAARRAGRGREPLLAFTARARERFGARQRLAATTGAWSPVDLAAGEDGRLLMALRGGSGVRAALRAPGARRFGRLERLTRDRTASAPSAAFAPDGRAAAVAWLGTAPGGAQRRPTLTVAVRR